MKKYRLTFIILVSISSQLVAQITHGDVPELAWYRTFGGSTADQLIDMEVGADGSIYLCGTYSGELNFFGEEVSTEADEYFVAKLDANGKVSWHLTERQLAIDSNEVLVDVLIKDAVLYVLSSVSIPSNSQTYDLEWENKMRAITHVGDLLWTKTYTSVNGHLHSYNPAVSVMSAQDGIIVLSDNRITKIDDTGGFIWESSLSRSGNFHSGAIIDSTVYVTTYSSLREFCFADTCVTLGNRLTTNDEGCVLAAISTKTGKAKDAALFIGHELRLSIVEDTDRPVLYGQYRSRSVIFSHDAQLDSIPVPDRPFDDQGLIVALSSDLNIDWYITSQDVEVSFRNKDGIFIDGVYYFSGRCDDSVAFEGARAEKCQNFIISLDSDGNVLDLKRENNEADELEEYDDQLVLGGSAAYDIGIWMYSKNLVTRAFFQSKGNGGQAFSRYVSTIDKDDNVYVLGTYEGSVSFGIDTLVGLGAYVVKIDSHGDLIWVKDFPSTNEIVTSAIGVNHNGDLFFYGSYNDTLMGGDIVLQSKLGLSLFYGMLDRRGNLLFLKDLPSSYAVGTGGLKMEEETITVVGTYCGDLVINEETTFNSGDHVNNGFVLKIDEHGEVLNAINLPSERTLWAHSIEVGRDGAPVLTGGFIAPTLVLENIQVRNFGREAAFVTKIGKSSDLSWSESISGENLIVTGHSIVEDGLGNIHVFGRIDLSNFNTNSPVEIYVGDQKTGTKIVCGNHLFIAKFSSSGVFLNLRIIQVDKTSSSSLSSFAWPGYKMSFDNQENLYLSGLYSGRLMIDGLPDVVTETYTPHHFILKYSPDGELVWFYAVKGIARNYAIGLYDALIGRERLYAIGGLTKGSYQLNDDSSLRVNNQSAVVAAFRVDNSEALVSNTKETMSELLGIYPNPSTDRISWVSTSNGKAYLVDALGKVCKHQVIDVGNQELTISSLPSGPYYLVFESDNGEVAIEKVIKN